MAHGNYFVRTLAGIANDKPFKSNDKEARTRNCGRVLYVLFKAYRIRSRDSRYQVTSTRPPDDPLDNFLNNLTTNSQNHLKLEYEVEKHT